MATAPSFDELLAPNDAVKLLEELLPAQTHSYLLGLKLGLPVHVVDGIFSTYLQPRDRLLHVLIAVLNQAEPRPTWKMVVEALRSKAVNLPQLARSVEAAHFPDPNATRDVTATTSATIYVPPVLGPTKAIPSGNASSLPKTHPRTESPISNPVTIRYLQGKIKEFERRFNGIKRASRTCLEKREVAVKQVADSLMNLPADDMDEHKQFLEGHLSHLYQANNQSELFGALSFNMNYLSYQLLDHIVGEFKLEVQEEMEVYKEDLQRFRESTPLLLFCRTQKKRYVEPPSRFQEVVGKFEWPEDITLEVVEQFRQEYACHYNLRECAMMLAEVRPGSFIVAWFIPESIAKKLKAKIPKGILEKFATAELVIGGECVYCSEDPQMEADVELASKVLTPESPMEESHTGVSAMRRVTQSAEEDAGDNSSEKEEEEFHITEDDCLFVEKPTHELFCPVTTDLLLQPHLTSCCGKHLSQEAASRIKKEGKACPLCNSIDWQTMLNKHFQRQVNTLKMFCCHLERGCKWNGELVQLVVHVQSCPKRYAPIVTAPDEYTLIMQGDGSPYYTVPSSDANREIADSPRLSHYSSHQNDQPQMMESLTREASEKNKLIPKLHIQLGRLVGHGETGLVYCGYIHGEFVAVKTAKALSSYESKKQLIKEATIMLGLSHPNVMPLTGICLDGDMPLLIMPFMIGGTLLEHVRNNKSRLYQTKGSGFEEVEVARNSCMDMCYQIAKGMAYIAFCDFIHRDLAARNCMICADGNVKVSDFGMAEDMYLQEHYQMDPSKEERVPLKWMAIESIEDGICNEKTDVWSFGVTCWEVFTCGAVPYSGVPALTLLTELDSGFRLARPSNTACSDKIWGILMRCWCVNPRERPNFASLEQILFNLMDSDPAYIKL